MKNTLKLLMIICSAVMFYGCSIPKTTHTSAGQLNLRIQRYKESVVEQREKLSGIVAENSFLSQSEDQLAAWNSAYTRLDNQLDSVASSFGSEVAPLLERNKREDDAKVKAALRVLSSELAKAIEPLPNPVMEAKFIVEVQGSTDKWLSDTQTLIEGCHRHATRLDDTASKYSELYPNRINDISKVVADTKVPILKSEQLRKTAVDELAKPTPEIDWAVVANSLEDSISQGNLFLKNNEISISNIRDLDKSYTKILEDMRVDFFVQVFRASWNNSSDSDTTRNASFPMQKVSREQYERMVSAAYPMTTVYRSWGDWKSQGYTELNRIINVTASWPSGHDMSEFWVEDSEVTYWHKYTLIENGKETKTDWIEVDEEEYLDYSGALGMSIESKPYGSFPDEAIEEPHPPAFAYVDNPKYGEWKQDDQGNRFWEFYTNYMMLNLLLNNTYGGYHYYENDYRGWRSGGVNRPYYGRTTTSFGTKSTQVQNSSKYRSTNYAQSGSFRNPPTAIRGSGPSRRGGGPSGGGK